MDFHRGVMCLEEKWIYAGSKQVAGACTDF